jgi:hypothetical protein
VQRAIGIPVNLFTGIFALARTVGWIAQLNEMISDPEYKIGRPRQLFTGSVRRDKMQGELSEYADGVRGHVRMHASISAIVQFLPEDLGAFIARSTARSRSTWKNTSPAMCCAPCRKARPIWASATPQRATAPAQRTAKPFLPATSWC